MFSAELVKRSTVCTFLVYFKSALTCLPGLHEVNDFYVVTVIFCAECGRSGAGFMNRRSSGKLTYRL